MGILRNDSLSAGIEVTDSRHKELPSRFDRVMNNGETGHGAGEFRHTLGGMLVAKGLITTKQLKVALAQQRVTGAILGETLISLGFLTSQDFAKTIAEHSGL